MTLEFVKVRIKSGLPESLELELIRPQVELATTFPRLESARPWYSEILDVSPQTAETNLSMIASRDSSISK